MLLNISKIERAFKSSGGKNGTLYIDGGYYLLPFILFLILFWFRRGLFLKFGGG